MHLALEGDCTVAAMADLRQTLQQALDRGEATELRFYNVTKGDLSFFELLLAAVAAFARRSVPLTLHPDLPAHLAFGARWTGLGHLCPQAAAALQPSPETRRAS